MKSEWEGEIEDSPVNLNDGESKTVILKRDPSTDTANLFANRVNFEYTTSSGSSTLILQKDPNTLPDKFGSTDMNYIIAGNMQVSGNSHLIMDLNSIEGKGLFKLYNSGGIIVSGSTVDINNVNTFIVDVGSGRSVTVEDGGTLKINNVDTVMSKSSGNAFSILNNNSTLHIEADVYNYDKNSLEGGGNFTQISNNAETTIEGSFYNIGFKSDYVIIYEALVEINGGKFTVTGDFENGKNIPNVYDDYYGVGNVKADNGALITVNGNFISDAQGEKFGSLDKYYSTVDLNEANLVVKGKFDVSRTDIYLKEIIIMHLITTKTITILTTITTIAIILLIQ